MHLPLGSDVLDQLHARWNALRQETDPWEQMTRDTGLVLEHAT